MAPTHSLTDMPYQEVLLIVTLIMAMVSMTMSSLALLPHLKPGATLVRDAVLWAALVVVFLSLVGLGWRYWTESPRQTVTAPATPPPSESDTVAQSAY